MGDTGRPGVGPGLEIDGADPDDGTGRPTEQRDERGWSPDTAAKLGTEYSPFRRKHCAVCGKVIPNYRRKYCPAHAIEGKREDQRRKRYNQRRQREADLMREAIRPKT